jgi:ABC-type multidrug transport system fused ATPase/permease subunit
MNGILICLGSSYIAATIPVALLALYWIQKYYLRTSRQMRLLDLEYKSPLYQQFTETLEGLETIRAFGWQDFVDREALQRLNTSQRPFYLLFMIQRWLNFVLDSLVCSLAILLVALATCLPNSSSAGAIGVALSSVLAFNTNLKGLIMTWTQLETSLGSVARTQSFEKYTPSEAQDENLDPGANWPVGKVDVSNMKVTYGFVNMSSFELSSETNNWHRDGTVALKNVSFSIEKGQKFGVCGRTGR